MSGITVELKHPIVDADGARITKLTLKRPTVGALKAADAAKTDMERAAILVEELSDLTPAAVDKMDGEDFERISEEIAGFFPKISRRKTGGR